MLAAWDSGAGKPSLHVCVHDECALKCTCDATNALRRKKKKTGRPTSFALLATCASDPYQPCFVPVKCRPFSPCPEPRSPHESPSHQSFPRAPHATDETPSHSRPPHPLHSHCCTLDTFRFITTPLKKKKMKAREKKRKRVVLKEDILFTLLCTLRVCKASKRTGLSPIFPSNSWIRKGKLSSDSIKVLVDKRQLIQLRSEGGGTSSISKAVDSLATINASFTPTSGD